MCIRDRVITADNEVSLQRAPYELQQIIRMYGLETSVIKTKAMAFEVCCPVRCKLVLNDVQIEQVHSLRFLGCDLSYVGEIDVDNRICLLYTSRCV